MEGFFLLIGVLSVVALLFFVAVTASAKIDWFDDEHAKEFNRDALNEYLDDCERKHYK